MSLDRIAVAGGGAFGTALALVAERAGRDVTLWLRDPFQAEAIRSSRENAAYLPGVRLPVSISVTADSAALADVGIVLLAVPAQAIRPAMAALAQGIRGGAIWVACAKGIEAATGLLPADIMAKGAPGVRVAALSGPGFAEEIAAGLPTAVTVAADDIGLAHAIAAALSSDAFRPYATDDLRGVELGGALKNVLAIAAGIVVGRGLGESARAALIARGLSEMTRLGVALGGRAETFMGLSGLGDLVLTAGSERSRNTGFGIEVGRGRRVGELLRPGAPLVEGAHTAEVAAALAARHGVDAPVIAAVAGIVTGAIGVEEAIAGLVNRPLKAENA